MAEPTTRINSAKLVPHPQLGDALPFGPGAILPDVLVSDSPVSLASARHRVRMAVVGVGGGGGNALRQMPGQPTVRRMAVNADAQALPLANADDRLCLGEELTFGRGAGGAPEVGEQAAIASRYQLMALLRGYDLVFLTVGLGGGTGSGAAPVIARLAHELGALVVGLATLPFSFEGSRRRHVAQAGLAQLEAAVDALFVIPNDQLIHRVGQQRPLQEAFGLADAALVRAVSGIVEIVSVPGLINLDFADIRATLQHGGRTWLSTGAGQGHQRATQALADAWGDFWTSGELGGVDRVLMHLTASADLRVAEIVELTTQVTRRIAPGTAFAFGVGIDPLCNDALRLTLIATGLRLPEHGYAPSRIGRR